MIERIMNYDLPNNLKLSLLSGYMHSLPLQEVTELLIKYRYGESKVKEYALRILKNDPADKYVHNLYSRLLREVKSENYKQKNNASALLIEFIEHLSTPQRHKLIKILLESRWSSIRRKAYGLFNFYNDELKEQLLHTFLNYKDETAAEVISLHAPVHVLEQLFPSLMSSTSNQSILRRVLFKLCAVDESYLPRLKEWHSISYYYFMAKYDKPCNWQELKEIYSHIVEDNKKGVFNPNDESYKSLILWSLARARQWKVIEVDSY